MAENPLMYISESEREQAIARSRRKFQTDYQSDMATSYDNGKAEGIKEAGMEAEMKITMEIAQNALRMNLPISDIVQLTGLSSEDIERLCSEE